MFDQLNEYDYKNFFIKSLIIATFPVSGGLVLMYIPILLGLLLLNFLMSPLKTNLIKWIMSGSTIISGLLYTMVLENYGVFKLYAAFIKYIYYYLWLNLSTP